MKKQYYSREQLDEKMAESLLRNAKEVAQEIQEENALSENISHA
jgi:hypothetical protein